jgi:thymidylate kinase
VVGAEGAGKTTLVAGEKAEAPAPTQGYSQFEKTYQTSTISKRISIWDVSGKEALKPLWSSYYKNIYFSAVIFVIDSSSQEIDNTVRDLHYLTNEEELRDSAFLVLFNAKGAKKGMRMRANKELGDVIRREDMHLNTKIKCYEIDFKSYDEQSKKAFKWLIKNIE